MSAQYAQPVTTGGIPAPQNLDDKDLADWLNTCLRAKSPVGYVHAEYACKVFNLADKAAMLHPADPEKQSRKVLKDLAKHRLLQHVELTVPELEGVCFVDPTWSLTPVSQDEIAALVDARLLALGRAGRGTEISPKTAWQVWTDAGGRCMFEGCGEDLTSVRLFNKSARIGYLAHIVASDPNGPRGNPADSHRLSDNSENIMLMCDAHHRLIDCFAPEKYPPEELVRMRRFHRDTVRFYLDSLAYPRVKAMTLLANLANVPTYFHDSELIDAVLAIGRAMLPNIAHYVRRNQRDDRRSDDFWVNYLHEHENDVRELIRNFNSPNPAVMDEWAVFPLHHIATMVLAGRIMGEARAIQVFQYHRERKSWRWDPEATPLPAGTFTVSGLTSEQVAEVLMTIELTARLDEDAMPVNLVESITKGAIPRVRITIANPNGACIRHRDDLDQFKSVARQAINHVQDVMRAQRVHLIAISPASTVFCFGQMLQAGHHPTYTIYDRPGRDRSFSEAFSVSSHEVTAQAGSKTTTIQIR